MNTLDLAYGYGASPSLESLRFGRRTTTAEMISESVGIPEIPPGYSFFRGLFAAQEGAKKRPEITPETEWSDHVKRQVNFQSTNSGSILVPASVFTRAQLAGTASLGGNVVANDLQADSFIPLLRNQLAAANAGAQVLTGLVGNQLLPRQSGTGTVYWAASETASTTESNITLEQVTLSPNVVTGKHKLSRQLMIQSTPQIEALAIESLRSDIMLAMDLACFHGTGSNGQPTGLQTAADVQSVAIGTDGGAPTWEKILEMETKVTTANGDKGRLAYVTNPLARSKLKRTFRNTIYGNSPLWTDGAQPGEGIVNNMRALATSQIASNLTKGTSTAVCSAIFFGNFAEMLIGVWNRGSVVEVFTDPYTDAATRQVSIYANLFVDVKLRHPEAFARILDATTTG